MNRRTIYVLGFVLWLAVLLAVLPSCSTVHQDAVVPRAAGSYVKPIRQDDGSFLVDDAFRDRYNALIAIYGKKKLENGAPVFVPPLEKDDGISGPVACEKSAAASGSRWYFMTAKAMEDMVVLDGLKHRGAAP